MSEQRQSLGLGALALLPIACCIGLPLVATASLSVAIGTPGIVAHTISANRGVEGSSLIFVALSDQISARSWQ